MLTVVFYIGYLYQSVLYMENSHWDENHEGFSSNRKPEKNDNEVSPGSLQNYYNFVDSRLCIVSELCVHLEYCHFSQFTKFPLKFWIVKKLRKIKLNNTQRKIIEKSSSDSRFEQIFKLNYYNFNYFITLLLLQAPCWVSIFFTFPAL